MEMDSSSAKMKVWSGDDFIDTLLSWSPENIFDENLYKDQIHKIPQKFNSLDHYYSSFIYPLLEETRAQIAASVEIIDKAPFAQVISIDGVNKHGEHHLSNVSVDVWKNRVRDDGEPYRTLPGDIVVISDNTPPLTAADLKRAGQNWTLASVDEIGNEDANFSTNFKLKMPIDLVDKFGKINEGFHIIFLENIATQKRIWNALVMRKNSKIIDTLLYTNVKAQERNISCSSHTDIGSTEEIRTRMLSKLNESQASAVQTCLKRVGCDEMSHVDLILGPPRTGKTSTISVLLFILLDMNRIMQEANRVYKLAMNRRTLICAPTNVGITQVATRVLKLVQESCIGPEFNSVRPVGDVVLFGDKDILKLGADIEDIYLYSRVDRLVEPLTGWRQCIESTITFLEQCVSDYELFVENEALKKNARPTPFLDFFKSRFEVIVSPLRSCMLILSTHLPRHFIQELNFQDIMHLISSLDSLKEAIFHEDTSSESLKYVFEYRVASDFYPNEVLLNRERCKCLVILKRLSVYLGRLKLPSALDKYSVMKFCLSQSSLVFCVASSSYKMHSVEMEPFEILVIDEATNLREYESIIPLQFPGLRHAVLVGDDCQLPATVLSRVCDDAGFGRSLFERLSSLDHSKLLIKTNVGHGGNELCCLGEQIAEEVAVEEPKPEAFLNSSIVDKDDEVKVVADSGKQGKVN